MGLPPRDHISSALLEIRWLPVSIIINLGLSARAGSGTKMPVINLVPFSLFVLPIFYFYFLLLSFLPFPLFSFLFLPAVRSTRPVIHNTFVFSISYREFFISILSINLAIPTGF